MKLFKRRLRGIISDMMCVNADNRLIWAPNVPVVYVDNPKSGSTTIKHSLKQAQAAQYERAGIQFRKSKNPHKRDDCLKTRGAWKVVHERRFVISCVRNPYTRALSGFLDKVTENGPKYFPELRGRKVETFEDHLLAIADFPAKKLNFHFRPQSINLDFPSIEYDVVFYLERISAFSRFFAHIAQDLTLETFAPHSTHASSKLRAHYTNSALDLVQKIYADDFALFGYSMKLADSLVAPGECITGGRVVMEIDDISDGGHKWSPRWFERGRFELTVRYHQLVEMLTL